MKGARFDGIVGVEGTIPFGAIVSCGHKGPRGNPMHTDRFFISSTSFEEINKGAKGGGFRNLRHPLNPRFEAFNKLPNGDKRAALLRGNLMFPERADCMNHHLAAQQLSGGGRSGPPGGGVWEVPPRAMPACTGDGKRARRYNGMLGDKPQFIEIDCPNRLCVFRQGPKKICGALGRLYFRLRWSEGTQDALRLRTGEGLPSILVRFVSHGWDTVKNMVGLFDAVEATADGLGMQRDAWTFAGLPFQMSVGMKSIPDKGRRFPVVSFAVEDTLAFLRWQTEQRQFLLRAPRSVALIGDGMKYEESTIEAEGESLDHITPGHGIPAMTDPEEEPDEDSTAAQAEALAVSAYSIDPSDPRRPGDRLRDHAVDALGLKEQDLFEVSRTVAGCNPDDVTTMFENSVAAELEAIAARKLEEARSFMKAEKLNRP